MSTPKGRRSRGHYFPTSQKVIGVTNPDMKEVIRAAQRAVIETGMSRSGSLFVRRWWLEGIFECQVIAFEMIGRDKKLLNALEL